MNKTETIIISTLHRVSGDITPRVILSTTLQTYLFFRTTIEEKSNFEKRIEALNEKNLEALHKSEQQLQNIKDSQSH